MPRISITLDQDTAEELAARIDDVTPSLEDVAAQALYQAARQFNANVGYRSRCTCDMLEKCADDPDIPVHFDSRTNEYWIAVDPAKSSVVVRYCFSCGGGAPASKRDLLFVRIPMEERSRLLTLCERIKTFEDAIHRLGPPDVDMPGGLMMQPTDGTDQEKVIVLRTITYKQLSKTADLLFTQRQDSNDLSLMFLAKPIENAMSTD